MVSKVSEITYTDVADYIRLDEVSDKEKSQLKSFIEVAKDYIRNYTGLADLDEFSDLVIVVYILAQDMYDNRTMYVDKNTPNKVVETILNMHCVNNL